MSEPSYKEILGFNLKKIRKAKGITYYQMKDKLRYELCKSVEEGEKDYTINTLLTYCELIGVTINVESL